MPLSRFTPSIRHWFESRFEQPTAVQAESWQKLACSDHVLISAPTGGGKSLAAWLPLLDRLIGKPAGDSGGVRVLYVSPLRALSRDMSTGILDCLEGLAAVSEPGQRASLPTVGLRTGDTPATERARQRRKPPDILLTTPESLYVLLGSSGGRAMLANVEAVVIDEIHALINNKRGAHLALSLERLQALVGPNLQRIGLSATLRPMRLAAAFLAGVGRRCAIVSPGHQSLPEVFLETPDVPLGPFAHGAHWRFVGERLQTLAGLPGNMLVFCNTRSQVEKVAAMLGEKLGSEQVAAHHGSIGRERRQDVEVGLKQGQLKVVVCSASLELGIDIGRLDRVCQIGTCSAISSFRQRAGRARHAPHLRPRIHVFPLSLSDLLDCRALMSGMEEGRVDATVVCRQPLDVLSQQIIAMAAAGETDIEQLFVLARRALPWRGLDRVEFDKVIEMLHEGFVSGRETARGPVFRVTSGQLGVAHNADKRCLLNAGTIPEWFEYEVHDAATGRRLGRLDEEFAFESSPGQIMQLGGQNWCIVRITTGRVEVEAAEDQVPNMPFWFGEGPGRSRALSRQVHNLCRDSHNQLDDQLRAYLEDSRAILGKLPGRNCIVLERFFDPGGDQHLVIHSLFGARLNRAWGLALRKRFCRNFNFELQAAAVDNGLLISLGAVHSFDLSEVPGWLSSGSIGEVLVQALLDTPIFQTRLRWCANVALAIEKQDLRGRVPAQIQRNQTENLIARIFPDQLACLENLAGHRRIPDHPLVQQALADCLADFMDLEGLERLYAGIEQGRVDIHAVDTAEPSPLALAMIHAPRHSFLDPAAAEERRTRAFESRPQRRQPVSAPSPAPGSVLHKSVDLEHLLLEAGYLTGREGEAGHHAQRFMALVNQQRAVSFQPIPGLRLWAHVERLRELLTIWPEGVIKPFLARALIPEALNDPDEALCRLLLARSRYLGSLTVARLGQETGLDNARLEQVLFRLKAEGTLCSRTEQDQLTWSPRVAERVAV
jgi:ATP-dependent helicase Lhr and Lhr-like helicase